MKIENPLMIFDLGNVILRHDDDYWLRQLTSACHDPVAARAAIDHYLKNAPWDRGEGTVRDFFDQARDRLGFIGDYDRFVTLWCCHFSHDDQMEDLFTVLAKQYRTVILSNTDDVHWRYLLQHYPVLHVAHQRYTSFELRMRKPDPAIYQYVLDAEGYQAHQAIFIDDRLENVQAAAALGIHSIHFTGREDLERELRTSIVF